MMEFRRGKTGSLKGSARGRDAVAVLLSEAELAAAEVPSGPLAGFEARLVALSPEATPDAATLGWARAIVIETDGKTPEGWERLTNAIRALSPLPVIAALREPTHGETRQCMHLGAVDVIALPLGLDELQQALGQARQRMSAGAAPSEDSHGRVIAFVKSVGGVGATALATQMGCLLAAREGVAGRETCLLDLDLQFGNAALYLGLSPTLSVADVIAAGARADGALLRSTTTEHPSGLHVVAAPPDIIPLESVSAEQMSDILDLARQEFSNVLVDLPGSWTNWSLSLVARADAVCLITEMSIPSLRQARRQLDMLASQDLGDLPIYVIVNRHERGFLKSIKTDEAEQALNHSIAATISNDFRTLSAAIDQGVPVSDIKMKTRLEKDMSAMIDMLLTHIEQRE
ncbi:hypothetical protein BSL82_16035 [Tardibacter chloracetimidivorans]|uniref:Uncharacterized protein n=1 Tax=Tardibacter chloracetimidivorans TaxID=1921510 RepID=A0A1L3ZYC1_9SPHN|nr:AAA family ATPase [Tardibacter chloracetimidivorans]API60610.1 hypothetical protein BSL82_16035 [Tardibacter chloracetimidivorans]